MISSWALWNHVFTFGMKEGSKRKTTQLGWNTQRSGLMESTANSDICLADVMATRKATLQVRKHNVASVVQMGLQSVPAVP